jgi:hypothetical protein
VGQGVLSDLRHALPRLAPLAVEWAEQAAAEAVAIGVCLDAEGEILARRVGVSDFARVRLVVAPELPFPDEAELRAAALETGLLGPDMAGLTLGHAIFIRTGELTPRLLSHELRHVAQYEAAGSIGAFLPVYLGQILHFGYRDAPFEVDARSHEAG